MYEDEIRNTEIRVSSYLNKKLNARNTFRGGVIASRKFFDLYARGRDDEDQQFKTVLQNTGFSDVWQAYGQWKYKINEEWTLNGGIHSFIFSIE